MEVEVPSGVVARSHCRSSCDPQGDRYSPPERGPGTVGCSVLITLRFGWSWATIGKSKRFPLQTLILLKMFPFPQVGRLMDINAVSRWSPPMPAFPTQQLRSLPGVSSLLRAAAAGIPRALGLSFKALSTLHPGSGGFGWHQAPGNATRRQHARGEGSHSCL